MKIIEATDATPATLTLYPKKLKALWILLGSSGFVALGIWMAQSQPDGWIGYLGAAFFGFCGLVAFIQLLPGSSYLRIDETGFTIRTLYRPIFVPWFVVDEFFVVTVKQTGISVHRMVGLNYVSSYDRAGVSRRISKIVAQYEGGLPDTYGMKAEELASLLNTCLERFRDAEEPNTAANA